MNQPELVLVKELEAAGITFDQRSFLDTFLNIQSEELRQSFSLILCRTTSKKEWIAEGGPSFFETQIWKRVRYAALARYSARCQCCGASASTGATLHVDHIKPRSKYPELALSDDNLQVLCGDCNIGKSNVDQTDWRGV
jgi:HNH endonuclease